MRVLLIGENTRLASAVRLALQGATFAVDVTAPAAMTAAVKSASYDAIVLDLNHDTTEGVAILRTLREQGLNNPILVFNGCDSSAVRVRLLEAGADECLVDPVSIEEIVVRTRVVLRRLDLTSHKRRVGDLELDYITRRVTRDGRRISLTRKEFAVLEYLMRGKLLRECCLPRFHVPTAKSDHGFRIPQ